MRWFAFVAVAIATLVPAAGLRAAKLTGEIRDAATGQPLAARLYIHSHAGQWFFARSADKEGQAVEYRKQRGDKSVEMHTTLSAHPFVAELLPAKYTLTV